MPRPKSTSTTKTTKSTDSTIATKKPRKPRAKKVATPAPEPVAEEEGVEETAEVSSDSTDDTVVDANVMDRLQAQDIALKNMIDALRAQRKAISDTIKQWRRESKVSRKRTVDPNRKKRAPYGIVMEVPITDELRDFVTSNGLVDKEGSTLAPGELCRSTRGTSFISDYVHKNSLVDTENGKFFRPDAALHTLLRLDEPRFYKQSKKNDEAGLTGQQIPVDKLSYSRLQTFLKIHFLRDETTSA